MEKNSIVGAGYPCRRVVLKGLSLQKAQKEN